MGAGGIVGLNYGTIDNCLGNFNIFHTGGIAGNNTNTGNIKNCSVFGSLHSGGGIVWINSGNIDNCKNYMSEIRAGSINGGIAGENQGINAVINSCVNYSNLSANSRDYSIIRRYIRSG
jgi:hypothetical protein